MTTTWEPRMDARTTLEQIARTARRVDRAAWSADICWCGDNHTEEYAAAAPR